VVLVAMAAQQVLAVTAQAARERQRARQVRAATVRQVALAVTEPVALVGLVVWVVVAPMAALVAPVVLQATVVRVVLRVMAVPAVRLMPTPSPSRSTTRSASLSPAVSERKPALQLRPAVRVHQPVLQTPVGLWVVSLPPILVVRRVVLVAPAVRSVQVARVRRPVPLVRLVAPVQLALSVSQVQWAPVDPLAVLVHLLSEAPWELRPMTTPMAILGTQLRKFLMKQKRLQPRQATAGVFLCGRMSRQSVRRCIASNSF
jgi:hypothetical protein